MYAENKSLISILEENKIALFKRMVYTEDFLEQLNIEQELKNVECRIERLKNGGI